jgi:hypothetical protein
MTMLRAMTMTKFVVVLDVAGPYCASAQFPHAPNSIQTLELWRWIHRHLT